jgi:integrase
MPPVSFARFRDEVLTLNSPPLRRKGTWDKLRQVLDEFSILPKPPVRKTSDLTPLAIAAWVRTYQDRRRPITSHSLLRSLRSAIGYGMAMGYLKLDPFTFRTPSQWLGVEPGQEPPKHDRHKTAEEVARVLWTLDQEAALGTWESGRLQALVYTLAFTGMRRSEALGLLTADVDLGTRVLHIRTNPWRPLKTRGSAAPLGITEELAAVLALWLPRVGGGPWAFPGARRSGPWMSGGPGVRALDQVKAAGLRAGVSGLTLLSFRHTLATLSESWGFGELELQRWLRHTRRRTQDTYRSPDLDTIRRSAAKIRFPQAR